MVSSFLINALSLITRKKLILPFYHTISNENVPHIRNLYRVKKEKDFIEDINFLYKNFKSIGLEDLKKIAQGGKRQEKEFFLSFDDGLREVYDVAVPILKRKGINAAIFINPAFVDNKQLFYRYKASLIIEKIKRTKVDNSGQKHAVDILKNYNIKGENLIDKILAITYKNKEILDIIGNIVEIDFEEFLKNKKPYLTSEQIQELINDGFYIGAHSMDHPEYRLIELEDQLNQTFQSVNFIKEKFQVPYKIFSFPFTDYGVKFNFFDQIFDSANPLIDLSFGTAGIKDDPIVKHFQRIPMEIGNRGGQEIILKQYFYYLIKLFLFRNTIKRS